MKWYLKVNLSEKLSSTEIGLISLIVILSITFLFFALIFSYQYFLYKKIKQLKKEYNKLINANTYGSLQYLQSLSANNDQFKQILSKIISLNKFYNEQLKQLKINIITTSFVHSEFKFNQTRKFITLVQKDLQKCHKLNEVMKELYSHSTSYTQEAAQLIAEFRITYDQIKNFYAKNLMNNYQQEKIFSFINKLSNQITFANEFQLKIDHDKLTKMVNEINETNQQFYKLITSTYIYNEAFLYLKRKQQKLAENIKNNLSLLRKGEINEVLKIQTNVDHQIQLLQTSLNELQFNKVNEFILLISEKIEPAVNIFNQNDEINLIIQNSLDYLRQSYDVLFENIKNVLQIFNEIKNYFHNYNDCEIENMLDDVYRSLRKNRMHYEQLTIQSKEENCFERINFIIELKDNLNQFKSWQKSFNNCLNEIINKHAKAINLINDVYELQLTLSQFYELNDYQISNSTLTLEVINKDLKHLNKIITLITNNYALNHTIANNMVEHIKDDVKSLYNAHLMDKTLQMYAKNLIFFANKYRYEDETISNAIDESEEFYNQNNFAKAIDTLLDVLEYIKLSAQQNKIKFN
ncbi:MAG: hypothetical protein B1217_0116 [Candidatus Malacoplasma girerdii]|nr:MAG: hypothetical protein B1217_0116 [Candidatus Malacoplasma girerdii]